MDYYILRIVNDSPDGAIIDALPENSPAEWRFHEGETLMAEFPEIAALKFSENFPDGRKLFDFVENILGLLIVSGQTKQLLESLEITNAEFLPVTIKDHKGNLAATDYAILNLLGSQDAIDMKRSVYRMNPLNKNQIRRIKKLVLSKGKIDPAAKMFRAKTRMRLFLIREDIHNSFVQQGITGFKAFPADGWNGFDF